MHMYSPSSSLDAAEILNKPTVLRNLMNRGNCRPSSRCQRRVAAGKPVAEQRNVTASAIATTWRWGLAETWGLTTTVIGEKGEEIKIMVDVYCTHFYTQLKITHVVTALLVEQWLVQHGYYGWTMLNEQCCSLLFQQCLSALMKLQRSFTVVETEENNIDRTSLFAIVIIVAQPC